MNWIFPAVLIIALLQGEGIVLAEEFKDTRELVDKTAPDQESSLAAEKALEQAGKLSETMRLPENIHAREGMEAARQSFGQFNTPAFQEKLRCQMERIRQQSGPPKEQPTVGQVKDSLAAQDPIYLFLSSSMPEAVVNRYLIDVSRTGGQRIIPIIFGLPKGMEGKQLNTTYFSRVLLVDTECRDTPASPCKRLDMPLRVNPVLFSRYNITEVPALVYDKGQDSWAVHGDAELAFLLEKLAKAANNPALASIGTRLRGGH